MRVTLPQIRPALVSAKLLTFISSFDELLVAIFLRGSNMTLPKKMSNNVINAINHTVAAVSGLRVVLVSILLAVVWDFGTGVKPMTSRAGQRRECRDLGVDLGPSALDLQQAPVQHRDDE